LKVLRWSSRPQLAVDLGTANTVVYRRGEGIVLFEPSVVAIDERTGEVHAVGAEARRMIGRTPAHISATRPLRDGVIADFEVTEQMLRHFIRKTAGKARSRADVMVCVPSGITQVERNAVTRAALAAGARHAFLIEEPMAAAIGAGLPVAEPLGALVVDIGGGTTETAVTALGSLAVVHSIKVGGYQMDDAIVRSIQQRERLLIGQEQAEALKVGIGSATADAEVEDKAHVAGRDLTTGLLRRTSMYCRTDQRRAPASARTDRRRRQRPPRPDPGRTVSRRHAAGHHTGRRRRSPSRTRRPPPHGDRLAGRDRRFPAHHGRTRRRPSTRGTRHTQAAAREAPPQTDLRRQASPHRLSRSGGSPPFWWGRRRRCARWRSSSRERHGGPLGRFGGGGPWDRFGRGQRWRRLISSPRCRSVRPPSVLEWAIRQWARRRSALTAPIFGTARRMSRSRAVRRWVGRRGVAPARSFRRRVPSSASLSRCVPRLPAQAHADAARAIWPEHLHLCGPLPRRRFWSHTRAPVKHRPPEAIRTRRPLPPGAPTPRRSRADKPALADAAEPEWNSDAIRFTVSPGGRLPSSAAHLLLARHEM
jgi:MreB/Mrl family cell shape determining protein